MREQEWLDKENGTTLALQGPAMSDTDRNIMRGLAGEADEPCVRCDTMVRPDHRGRFEFTLDEDGEQPVCEDCYIDAEDEAADARAEAIREARWERQEADFNARWPV